MILAAEKKRKIREEKTRTLRIMKSIKCVLCIGSITQLEYSKEAQSVEMMTVILFSIKWVGGVTLVH